MPGFLSQWSRELDPHLWMRRENWGSSWVVAGHSVFLLSGYGYVGELLELPQGCQGPFWGSRGKVGFLSICHSGKGPHLMLRGESSGFSRVVASWETAWGILPVAKFMRKGTWQNAKVGPGLRGPPGFSWASTPTTRVCQPYCIMLPPILLTLQGGCSRSPFSGKS